jgi:ribosome maturation protein Sdo1
LGILIHPEVKVRYTHYKSFSHQYKYLLQYIKKRKVNPVDWKELLPEAIEKALPPVELQPQKTK